MDTEVLIVGAGPTGLVLALWLTKLSVKVRIIDKNNGVVNTSRALAVQARTLELYRQLDLDEAVMAAGHKTPAINFWVHGKRRAKFSFSDVADDITKYPFLLIYPQDHHEKLLIKKLQELGVSVYRNTELIDFTEHKDHISAKLRENDKVETCKTLYIAGCDGASSFVRHKLGTQFPGGTYKQIFYVADVEVSGITPANEAHMAIDSSDFVAILPYNKTQSRLIGTIQDDRAKNLETLEFKDVNHEAIDRLKLKIDKINWFSTYRVHHRIASQFKHNNIFLLGDGAHIHSPAGGQGMNTGILDAINLAWKLAEVIQGRASENLLSTYEIERQEFARKLVHTTDRIFTFVSSNSTLANFIRINLAPLIARVVNKIKWIRKLMFSMISQTKLNYQNSPLSIGKAGRIKAGDRLPWVKTSLIDNYDSLRKIQWQIHIYGSSPPDIIDWCTNQSMPLHVFKWCLEYKKAGFSKDALYLIRPDTYVALAAAPTVEALDKYFTDYGI